MKETESLLKRSERYLKSAALLLNDGGYESAVSRVYYAMFYATQAVLLTKKLSFSSHKSVLAMFGEYFIKTEIFPKEMGRELNRAFAKRQIGDYTHAFVISHDEAVQLLAAGRQFVTTVEQYFQENPHL